MTDQWTCPQCQHTHLTEMRFCPQCGTANPAFLGAAPTSTGAGVTPRQGNRRMVWIAAIGLWLIGCVVLAVGGGIWWSRQSSPPPATLVVVVENSPSPTLPFTPTPTLVPSPSATFTPSPEPKDTATPAESEPADSAAGDALAGNASSHEDTTVGDTLSLPTRPPEGVILFLSSRDHDPQTEADRKRLAQHRDLELYAMRPDGSEVLRLSDGQQAWSSDAAWLTLYAQPNQVVVNGEQVFDLSSGQITTDVTTEFTLPDATAHLRANYPVWSSGGDMVFFGVKSPAGERIYYLEKGQSRPRQLTDPPDNVSGDSWSALSPDGTWIVFERFWQDPAKDGLWLIKPDGSEAHRVVEGETRRAFWSPDGQQLAFEGPKSNKTNTFSFDIWVAKADGSNPRSLTAFPPDVNVWEPKWSPDGQRLIFEVERSFSDRQLYVLNLEDGEPELLTHTGEHNIAPLWLPLPYEELNRLVAAYPTPAPSPTPKPVVVVPTLPPSNCPPGAQITSPPPGAIFTERYNYILGTANINRFHHWRIEYSTNGGAGWNYLLEHDYPVENDKLIMLDASTVPNGSYGLRLTVVDETGNYPEPCVVWYTNLY